MHLKLLSTFSLTILLTCTNIYAEENIEDDLSGFDTEEVSTSEELDDLAGFADEEIVSEDSAPAQEEKQSNHTITGDLAFKTSYGYKKHSVDGIEYSGFNQAQTSLYLQLDSKISDNWKLRASTNMFYDAIYDLHSNNNYRNNVLDTYEKELRVDDAYIQGSLRSDLDLKIGRQRVVWGKSDTIRITDVINPLDNRLPGMTDIEDLRLSVGMAKLDYYTGHWNLSAMVIGESRIMLEAAPRGEFFPVNNIFPTAPDPFMDLVTPNSSLDDVQYALAANGIFSGWDLSFYAANVLDQKWHIENGKRVVNRINMLGSALNIASGNWLFKSEAAFLNGIKYNTTNNPKNRLDALVGFDYMGFTDTVLSIEIANRHIFNHESQMSALSDFVDKNEIQTALRASRSFLNDTLNATFLLSMFGSSWENGGFNRIWFEYDIVDNLSTNFGIVNYIAGHKPLTEANRNNDRIFTDLTYSF